MNTDPRYDLITERLRAQGYRPSASHPGSMETEVLCFEVWVQPALGKIRIVQIFRDQAGYEVFKPVALPDSNDIQDTLDAI